jgi:hypothetical protein
MMRKMVDWYDPRQLLNTARKTAISETIGEYADPRLGTAEAAQQGEFFDYSKLLRETRYDFKAIENEERDEIWIDYVADVGDGWNSTYSVALNLAQPHIKVEGVEKNLRRGEILFFGGDAVYPSAAEKEYDDRLVQPYRMAFKAGEANLIAAAGLMKELHVFALPGNHDWYDSLTAFKDLFCSHIFNSRRFAGGWHTRQKRSYFSIKLPHKWWLLAVDMQLSHNIDVSQLQYFESIIEKMEAGSRVILCVSEPFWVKAIKYQKVTDEFDEKEKSIERLERFFSEKQVEVKVYIAGDLHHYRRFADENGVHKITAGGGGAFLHPTHDYDYRHNGQDKDKGFYLKADYPSFEDSRKLDWKNLLFVRNNKTFGIFTALIYAMVGWLIFVLIDYRFSWEALVITVNRVIAEPSAFLTLVAMFGGLIFFTDSRDKRYKWLAGIAHGLTHLAAIFICGLAIFLLTTFLDDKYELANKPYREIVWFVCAMSVAALGGYILGSIIMGIYLFVSLHFFGRHDNEAFSALKIEDYKNFLRLHVSSDGHLTIYPLKIAKVSKAWNPVINSENEVEFYKPASDIEPELIEKPIVI